MKVRWSMMPGGVQEVPSEVLRLPPELEREHVRFGELRLDAVTPVELQKLVDSMPPAGCELVLRFLLRAIEDLGTWWQTRGSAMELVRRMRYQPAIPTLTEIALSNEADVSSAAVALGELRADRSLIRLAKAYAKSEPNKSLFVLEQLLWTPTRMAYNILKKTTARARRERPSLPWILKILDALESFGKTWSGRADEAERALRWSPTLALGRPRPMVLRDETFPGELRDLDLVAWESSFDYLVAAERGPVSPLDFGQAIVFIRDALLGSRKELDPLDRMDDIMEIDGVLYRAVDGLELLREIGRRLANGGVELDAAQP